MNEMIKEWLPYLIVGTACLSVLLLILVIVQSVKLSKMRRRYEGMMNGTGVQNLEELLMQMNLDLESMHVVQEKHAVQMKQLLQRVHEHAAHLGIERYNAFGEYGNNLSFSLALINDDHDGIVLTGIHGREHTYVYAKPVEKGQSQYTLSPEEQRSLETAISKVQAHLPKEN
ncbi:DUF4446 family protein [Paenibacillus sp. 1001270B_150601_E10]|uniref:DUF4446 family protein n=1 Tax=Paenibacillus sp. 1001270B_150601_E10 TaxID=2787079 RepID=UPI00189DD52B|nr:DUF4446 family protein [Paenibacillus sp. 1001270B_150601_E10]